MDQLNETNCATQADLDSRTYKEKVKEFLNSQRKTEEEIRQIEIETRLQRGSPFWWRARKNLLTASNFGTVCRRLPHTKCDNLVSKMLYGEEYSSYSMVYGRENEKNAIKQMKELGYEVLDCGMFIDKEFPFLAATPDGLIGNEGILEVKCPSSAESLTPEEAILQRKGVMSTFWKVENNRISGINQNHSYFYQIQGQLHITGRNFALFTIWTPRGIKIERVEKNDGFWNEFIIGKLKSFYMDCMLPEIVDSRRERNLPIRNPRYILEAIGRRQKSRQNGFDIYVP